MLKILGYVCVASFLIGCATSNNINKSPIGAKLPDSYYTQCEDNSVSLKNPVESEILQLIRTLRGDLKKCAQKQKDSIDVIKSLTK